MVRSSETIGSMVPLLLDPAGKTRLVRVSAQLYNTRDDYERLAAALLTLL